MIYKTMEFKSFYFLVESKQDIVNLYYPEIIAKLFYMRQSQFGPSSSETMRVLRPRVAATYQALRSC